MEIPSCSISTNETTFSEAANFSPVAFHKRSVYTCHLCLIRIHEHVDPPQCEKRYLSLLSVPFSTVNCP